MLEGNRAVHSTHLQLFFSCLFILFLNAIAVVARLEQLCYLFSSVSIFSHSNLALCSRYLRMCSNIIMFNQFQMWQCTTGHYNETIIIVVCIYAEQVNAAKLLDEHSLILHSSFVRNLENVLVPLMGLCSASTNAIINVQRKINNRNSG